MSCLCEAHVLTERNAPRADADPERVELIPGLFDEMAAALPFPQRQPPGQRAERPAHPAAMCAPEPASAGTPAYAAAPGAAGGQARADSNTAALSRMERQIAAHTERISCMQRQLDVLAGALARCTQEERLERARAARAQPSTQLVPSSAAGGHPVQGGSGAAAGGSGAAVERSAAASAPPAVAATKDAAVAAARDIAAELNSTFPEKHTLR